MEKQCENCEDGTGTCPDCDDYGKVDGKICESCLGDKCCEVCSGTGRVGVY